MNKETLNETLTLKLCGIPLSHSKLGNPFKRDPSLPFIDVRGEAQYKMSGQIPLLLFKGEYLISILRPLAITLTHLAVLFNAHHSYTYSLCTSP